MGKFTRLYPWQWLSRASGARLACRVMPELSVDTDQLKAEVAAIVASFTAAAHSGAEHHDGGWRAIGLIAHDGDPRDDRLRLPLRPTPALALAPSIARLLDVLPAEKLRVRLMELQPGTSIYWHYDRGESIDGGASVRLHLPIVTNPRMQVQIGHEDLTWREGELWYGDFSFPHRLFNGGGDSRVHLVIDLKPNDFVRGIFPEGFLAGAKRRLRVKHACQRLTDLNTARRLPRGQRLPKVRQALGLASKRRRSVELAT